MMEWNCAGDFKLPYLLMGGAGEGAQGHSHPESINLSMRKMDANHVVFS